MQSEEPLREERSRQHDEAVRGDWKFQVELKQRRAREERERAEAEDRETRDRLCQQEREEAAREGERQREAATIEREARAELTGRRLDSEAEKRAEEQRDLHRCLADKSASESETAREKRVAFEASASVSMTLKSS